MPAGQEVRRQMEGVQSAKRLCGSNPFRKLTHLRRESPHITARPKRVQLSGRVGESPFAYMPIGANPKDGPGSLDQRQSRRDEKGGAFDAFLDLWTRTCLEKRPKHRRGVEIDR